MNWSKVGLFIKYNKIKECRTPVSSPKKCPNGIIQPMHRRDEKSIWRSNATQKSYFTKTEIMIKMHIYL